MNIYIEQIPAYVYKITCTATNQFYYGSRHRNQKLNLSPKDDIWTKYFTSSKEVKKLINEYGKDNFTVEIILENVDYDVCYWEEQQLIKNNIKNLLNLNKHFVDPDTGTNRFSNFGNTMNDSHKKSLKEKNIKTYTFLNKNNEKIVVENLQDFCVQNNLSYVCMIKVNSGSKKYHKGYRSTKNFDYISFKEKIYKFIDPQGNVIETENLTQFCKDNNLNRRHMVRLFKCLEKSHKGYRSFYDKDSTELADIISKQSSKINRTYSYPKTTEEKEKISRSIKGKNNPCARKFTAISLTGEKFYLHGNLDEFCYINDLKCPSYVHKCMKKDKPYKGWTFYRGHI